MSSRTVTLGQLMEVLRRVLSARDSHGDEFFIINVGDHSFVQFAIHGDGSHVCGEAVGNHYRDLGRKLTGAQVHTLEVLGWTPPAADAQEEDHHAFNFFREWDMDAPTEDIVRDVTQTLAAVFLSGEGSTVELKCGSFLHSECDWPEELPG